MDGALVASVDWRKVERVRCLRMQHQKAWESPVTAKLNLRFANGSKLRVQSPPFPDGAMFHVKHWQPHIRRNARRSV